MGGSYRSCSWEVKAAAAKAVVDGAELARSTHYYALSRPKGPARPELRDAAAEILSRTANGCGHRRIAMCLRAEQGAVVADKTVLEMMHQSLAAYFLLTYPSYGRSSRRSEPFSWYYRRVQITC